MSANSFDFDSGNISLDFANTNDWHASAHPQEKLVQYEDLVDWGEAAGLVPGETAERLRRQAQEKTGQAAAARELAVGLREAIYRIFSRRYAGQPVAPADLALLNSVVRKAGANLELALGDDGEMRWAWAPGMDGDDLILWPVARAAADLLTSAQAERVRECEDDRGCGYLFIDQSKNRSRRWCSMESCGNRAKARRHYSKAK